jgi:hypothetical protein
MSRVKEFPLPDLGEGLTEGEILKWFVAEGDTVTQNQPIVEVETAKAAVEIPAKWAGKVPDLPSEARWSGRLAHHRDRHDRARAIPSRQRMPARCRFRRPRARSSPA